MNKTKRLILVLSAIGLMPLAFTTSVAQDGIKYGDDTRYIRVVFVSYKPGKAAEAYGIINNHFMPAGQAAGLPGPITVHFQTGPYDAAMHWALDNGPAEFEWRITPGNAQFRAALVEHEGSEEAAQAIMDRYNSLIARTTSALGHRHVPAEE